MVILCVRAIEQDDVFGRVSLGNGGTVDLWNGDEASEG